MDSNVPLCIIGAGRSGTTFLSKVLEQDPRFWNCYENRYIWNYGQRFRHHDVRGPEEATPQVAHFIRRCHVPCYCIPRRSWPLFRAREWLTILMS